MKDLTKNRLRRLAEQLLRIARDDDEIGAGYLSIHVTREGYMSIELNAPTVPGYDETRLPNTNCWKTFPCSMNPQDPLAVTETYKCFNCRKSKGYSEDGTVMCNGKYYKSEVDAMQKACEQFEDCFYSSESQYTFSERK